LILSGIGRIDMAADGTLLIVGVLGNLRLITCISYFDIDWFWLTSLLVEVDNRPRRRNIGLKHQYWPLISLILKDWWIVIKDRSRPANDWNVLPHC
jgi:hypothetical protein